LGTFNVGLSFLEVYDLTCSKEVKYASALFVGHAFWILATEHIREDALALEIEDGVLQSPQRVHAVQAACY
jgi:hypothetical protein